MLARWHRAERHGGGSCDALFSFYVDSPPGQNAYKHCCLRNRARGPWPPGVLIPDPAQAPPLLELWGALHIRRPAESARHPRRTRLKNLNPTA
jgi:hypothetical protein